MAYSVPYPRSLSPHLPAEARSAKAGFTLLELSMVLVIIGLIVGGILVGQDMIKAAEIRSTISQLEKYKSAVNTFRIKYNSLPGDMIPANAAAYGFTARAGSYGRGDGDGFIEGDETLLFWSDLSMANLVDGSFTAAIDTGNTTYPAAALPTLLPTAKLSQNAYIVAIVEYGANMSGPLTINSFVIAGLADLTVDTSSKVTDPGLTFGANSVLDVMTPRQAFAIDQKIDDGWPRSGRVWSQEDPGGTNGLRYSGTGNDNCINTSFLPWIYNTTPSFIDHAGCRLMVGFQ
jgi:prepilin-type N-terminal cleavage/methylation domain-containing protein